MKNSEVRRGGMGVFRIMRPLIPHFVGSQRTGNWRPWRPRQKLWDNVYIYYCIHRFLSAHRNLVRLITTKTTHGFLFGISFFFRPVLLHHQFVCIEGINFGLQAKRNNNKAKQIVKQFLHSSSIHNAHIPSYVESKKPNLSLHITAN